MVSDLLSCLSPLYNWNNRWCSSSFTPFMQLIVFNSSVHFLFFVQKSIIVQYFYLSSGTNCSQSQCLFQLFSTEIGDALAPSLLLYDRCSSIPMLTSSFLYKDQQCSSNSIVSMQLIIFNFNIYFLSFV